MDSLGRFVLLKKHKEFQYIYIKGKNAHSLGFILFFLHKQDISKIGFTATKKLGNAVVRNRFKRRMRALFYQNLNILRDGYYVLVAKKNLDTIDFKTLDKNFKKLISKIGALKDD